MAHAAVAQPPPLLVRLFEALPVSPAWIGVGIAAALFALYFGVEIATGELAAVLDGTAPAHIRTDYRTGSICVLILAYLATALAYHERWDRRNLELLRPALAPGAAASLVLRPRRARWAGVVGVLALAGIYVGSAAQPGLYFEGDFWVFVHAWNLGIALVIGWLAGHFVYALVADSRNLSTLAARLGPIDLLDLVPLAPFVRQGLRSALHAVVLVSLISLLFIDAGRIGWYLFAQAFVLAAAVAGLVLPVRGVHTRIRQEKRVRLAELRAEIRADERALRGDEAEAERAARRLPALLALEARIDAVREWPFDASSLTRFALYVAIGLGSWLGAAAVERMLDAVLGA